eukprot:gene9460-10447_t
MWKINRNRKRDQRNRESDPSTASEARCLDVLAVIAIAGVMWKINRNRKRDQRNRESDPSTASEARCLDDIAGKLAKGITIESILDHIRDSTADGLYKQHVINRKDVINVKHQMNANLMEKDPKDTRSVHYWVNELEKGEFNPVLIYKPQRVKGYSLPALTSEISHAKR